MFVFSAFLNRYYSQLSDDDVKKHLEILTNHVEKYSPKYAPITLTSNITLPPVQFTQLPKASIDCDIQIFAYGAKSESGASTFAISRRFMK